MRWPPLRPACRPGARVLDAGAGEVPPRAYFARQRYCGVDLAVGDRTWNYSRLEAVADLARLPFARRLVSPRPSTL